MAKRGWMRILESVIAVLIMASVLIVIYTNKPVAISYSDYVSNLEINLLDNIGSNESLRAAVLDSNTSFLKNYIVANIPSNFNSDVVVCNLDQSSNCIISISSSKEVFVEGRMISANLTKYDPKLVRIYVWEK